MQMRFLFFTFIYSSCAQQLLFPNDFKFGVATSSYQIEGGWNASGKGENIWDHMTHNNPKSIQDKSNGDIACDSYHLWKTDVQLLKNLGVHFYRFSLSWSRLLPNGLNNRINYDGVHYYNNLIDELLKYNIEPVVTLYHWDLPQGIQNIGGWPNIATADYFMDYAKVAFDLFGDRVKTWITFNEPIEICVSGYGGGDKAPRIIYPGISDYLCGKTILIAHAKVYHLYNNYYRAKQRGKIGITIDTAWNEPNDNTTLSKEASELSLQMQFGWWAHPIFSKNGDYPNVMKERIANISKLQNFKTSRLPNLINHEINYIKGTADFVGVNHYSTVLTSYQPLPKTIPVSFYNDLCVKSEVDPKWKPSAATWVKDVPWGLRKLLNWIKNEYSNPVTYVTENGYPDLGELNDVGRINYLQGYLKELLLAVVVDKCNVAAYTVWSLLDNMEWAEGYKLKFGLYNVNFSDPTRKRTAKSSVEFYKNIIKSRMIPFDNAEVYIL
ncbi:hypothetical protein RN001_006308 [Aquatica leii]|uniref:Beta-glucosidase n=1 Tax=Aquatica leii TaxID=1421715 RepID=A0AAN7SJR4_9COLE|nr:hypothetical protein RN001_006308 [Aquatica leii]